MFIVVVFATSMFLAVSAFVVGTTSVQQFHRANSEYHTNNLAVIGQAISSSANENPISVYHNGLVYLNDPNTTIDMKKREWRYLHFREPLSQVYKAQSGEFQTESSGLRVHPKPIHKVIEYRLAIWMDSPMGGANDSLSVNIESGTYSPSLIEGEQQRMFRLSRKFHRFYADARSFKYLIPVKSEGRPLTHLLEAFSLGETVTASTCDRIHATMTSPPIYLNCNDLFNAWGEPIYAHVPSRANELILTNVLGLKYLNGTTVEHVRMAEEINIEIN